MKPSRSVGCLLSLTLTLDIRVSNRQIWEVYQTECKYVSPSSTLRIITNATEDLSYPFGEEW